MLFIVEPCKASIYFYFHWLFQWIWFEFLLTTFFTTIFSPWTILHFCCEFKLAGSCDVSIQYFERPHLTPHASPLQGNTVITFQDFSLITCHLTSGLSFFFSTEEVLNSDHALYFSPDGQFLAYIQFNDSKVNWYQFPWYGDRKNAYTTIRKIAYPKPGYSNPTVKVFVIDLKNNKRVQLPEPSSFKDMWVFS